MEKTVFIREQLPLISRPYTASDGTQKVFHSRGFILSDGVDEFYAEMLGDMARDVQPFEVNIWHRVQAYIKQRQWQDKNGQTRYENQIVITKMV